jgi:starch synthase
VLSGILNGMDASHWSPSADPHLAANYDAGSVGQGKPVCKAALQKELGLPIDAKVPLVGFVGRLTPQKGLDLMAEVLPQWLQTNDVQWAILGTGQPKYHELLQTLSERFPRKLAVRLEFSNPLAHRIEAGADLFLMPSRFEPCGLNQLYSLRYGTVPIVRKTGGLADTIENYDPKTGNGTGFVFKDYDASELLGTVKLALGVYKDKKAWTKLMKNGMAKDFSWAASAKKYVELYQKAIQKTEVVSA